ncbi:amidase [Loktanella sp. S4079]|uniref:amidase n=1 Tax=Loktanella sp. S4079 TaxID=579483 RepID=UPI000695B2F4|nr:amidase [Loktanella sp. S4079]
MDTTANSGQQCVLPANPFDARDLPENIRPIATPRATQTETTVAPGGVLNLLDKYRSGVTTPADEIARFHQKAQDPIAAEAVLECLDCAEAIQTSTDRWASNSARPLEGIPFGIKAIVDVKGADITCGSFTTGTRIADHDAPIVARLRAAGAIPVAMLATTEFAAGSPFNPRHGVVTNPYDSSRWTGGSSTGSGAAVARRMLPFALGTDTGGSIRVPSCWCGITGLKPTHALLSTQGVAPLSWTLDHIGPMGLSAADILQVMKTVSDADFSASQHTIKGLRIGVPDGWFSEKVDAAVLQSWQESLRVFRDLGATCVPIKTSELFGDMARNHDAGWTILSSELSASQRANAPNRHLQDAGLQARIARGDAITAAEYLLALSHRTTLIQHLTANWNVDVLITPGLGGEAGHLNSLTIDINEEQLGFDAISRNTMIWDLTGFPALMLPSGIGPNGLPLGIQIIGRPFDDALCLAFGAAFQNATKHHLRCP